MFLSERSERNQRIAKGEPHEISALKRLISYDVSPLDSHYEGRGTVFAEKPFRRVFWNSHHNRAGRYALTLHRFRSICNSRTAPDIPNRPVCAALFSQNCSIILYPAAIPFRGHGSLTLPTAKAGGFSVRRPQPAPARSYMISPSV